jgi:hypothetical protein
LDSFSFGKEAIRTVIAAVVAYFVSRFLRAAGVGKWLTAGGSGAVGSIAAIAVVA